MKKEKRRSGVKTNLKKLNARIGRGKFWDAKKFKQYKSKIRLYSVQQPGPEDCRRYIHSQFYFPSSIHSLSLISLC